MDYRQLFVQAWDLIWKNKFLIFLGMLVVLGGVGWGGGGSQGYSNWDGNSNSQNPPQFEFDFSSPFQELGLPALASVRHTDSYWVSILGYPGPLGNRYNFSRRIDIWCRYG